MINVIYSDDIDNVCIPRKVSWSRAGAFNVYFR